MKVYLHVCFANFLESDYGKVFVVVDLPSVPRAGDAFYLASKHKTELERQIEALPDKEKYYDQYTFCGSDVIYLDDMRYVLDVHYGSGEVFKAFGHDYAVHLMLGNSRMLESLKEDD